MVGYPPYGTGNGGFLGPGGAATDGAATTAEATQNWEYTLLEAARAEVGFEPMDTHIQQTKNTVTQYTATQLLLDLCEAADRNQGKRVGIWWW